jgi:hypothetical protein
MTIDSPRGENSFGKTILARSAHVIHHFVPSILNDGFANASGDCVEGFIPTGSFPLSSTAFTGAFEWVKNAIGISYLVECGWTFGAIAATRTGMLRIAFKLLYLASNFVDISKQPARRLAIEAGGGNDRIMSLLPLGPRP